jgi:hypothetical protein
MGLALGIFLTAMLLSCGSKESVSVRFALAPKDIPESRLSDIDKILTEFNELAGSQIAYLCADDCNGSIGFDDQLQNGVVGLCEPSTYTESKSSFSIKKGLTTRRKKELRADIKLVSDLKFQGDYELLRTIIFHELGHGLLLDHSSGPSDVMFATVNGEKNLESFFVQVRQRIGDFTQ